MTDFNIIIEKGEDGYFISDVVELPGCHSQGKTIDELLERTKEAIELYITELKETGQEIPDDSQTLEYSLNLIDA